MVFGRRDQHLDPSIGRDDRHSPASERMARGAPGPRVDAGPDREHEPIDPRQAVLVDGGHRVRAQGHRLGVAHEHAVRAHDRHIVRNEPPAALGQQAQHGARLAGVSLRRHDQRATIAIDCRTVQQNVAPRREPEAQDGLDHVRVQDVMRPMEQPVRLDAHWLVENDVERGAQQAEVLAVRDTPPSDITDVLKRGPAASTGARR